MTVDRLLNVLALVTLVEMMIFVGLSASLADFVDTARNARLAARGILANYVLVPAVTVALLMVFRPPAMVAVGFLILAVCPGGPYGPTCTAVAKGKVGVAAGLMVILAGLSSLLSPVLLGVLVPLLAGGEPLRVDAPRMALTLLVGQVLPLLAGLAVHQWRPRLAVKLEGPARQGAKILNTVFLLAVLLAQYRSLFEIRLLGYFGMLLLLTASIAIGWLLGGPASEVRKAMALTTSVRNNGVGMVIATAAFGGTPAVTAAVVYGLVGLLGSLLVAVVWGRRAQAAAGVKPAPAISRGT